MGPFQSSAEGLGPQLRGGGRSRPSHEVRALSGEGATETAPYRGLPLAPPTLLPGTGLGVLLNGTHEDTLPASISTHGTQITNRSLQNESLHKGTQSGTEKQKDGPQRIKAGPVNSTACTGPDHHSPSLQTHSPGQLSSDSPS